MQVVFCTYQSAPVLAEVLEDVNVQFDLMICDEAHRTTGIQSSRAATSLDAASGFHMVHEDAWIPARKRLYMTATPRVFTEQLRRKAEQLSDETGQDIDSFSMDDEEKYGVDLFKMSFAEAIDQGLLTDYELLVIAVSDSTISDGLRQEALVGKFDIDDVVRLMGCWDALADPETQGPESLNGSDRRAGRVNSSGLHARAAIAFSNTVRSSKQVRDWWARVVEEQIPLGSEMDEYLQLSVEHIDGSTPASKRAKQIAELRNAAVSDRRSCRVLSNARVLTEGVDVPALDAVIFLENRKSKIDITQAVGRVMRRAPGKDVGYVIVPVVVPEDKKITDKEVLDGSDFKIVWDVVRALRSHDERVDYWVNNLAAVKGGRSKIRVLDRSGDSSNDESAEIDLFDAVQLRMRLDDKIASKIVEMAGDRRFWPTWGERAAKVCDDIHIQLQRAVEAFPSVETALSEFVTEMQGTVGPRVTRASATEMIAQHVVTIPVFDHIFEESRFAAENPVSKEINRVLDTLAAEGVSFEQTTANLARSYRQMQRAFDGAESPAEKVDILRQIYEGFFHSAMKDTVKQLGIVYTPVELVDFILRSTDAVCRQEFGYGLTDKEVNILDPFAGTGTFLYRLLTLRDADGNFIIRDADLQRKYREELHANEIVLLAYYIAALKIESAMAERGSFEDDQYEEFPGMVLQDSMLPTLISPTLRGLLTDADNSDRAELQEVQPIQVIVTNPPWSSGQDDAGEDNPNLRYEQIAGRVRATYGAAQTKVTGRAAGGNAAGNLYIQALRWMSDRLPAEGPGMIGFVHPNSLANANSLVGVRKSLRDEFTSIYVINLRGNAYTTGAEWQAEGDKVFGGSSRNGGQLTLLVRNPSHRRQSPASVHYAQVPDAMTLEEKLSWLGSMDIVRKLVDFEEIPITPQHDWVNLPDETFGDLMRLCGKAVTEQDAIVKAHASGVKTNCDDYVYAFSRDELIRKVKRLLDAYQAAREELDSESGSKGDRLARLTANDSLDRLKWTETLKGSLRNGEAIEFSEDRIREVTYRPFTKVWLYEDFRILSRGKSVAPMFPIARAID